MTDEHGGNIYQKNIRLDFSSNINPLGMSESVIRAACEGVKKSFAYPDPECRELKEAISLAEGIPIENLICGNGAAELIYLIADAVKPQKAMVTAPSFSEYEKALTKVGCSIRFYVLEEETAFSVRGDFTDFLTPDLDMVFLCNPNNPTGMLIHRPLLEKIIRKCAECQILLVLDECFIGLTLAPSMKDYIKETPYLFILRAFTKLYGMPGLRLGYGMCGDRSLLENMSRGVQPWNVSLPAQLAGIAALGSDGQEDFSVRTKTLVSVERGFLAAALDNLGFACREGAANFLLFKGPGDLGDWCMRHRIMIRDCSNYRGLEKGYWRIAVRTHEENELLIRVLEAYRLLKAQA